jgi:hypothetical protein
MDETIWVIIFLVFLVFVYIFAVVIDKRMKKKEKENGVAEGNKDWDVFG